MNKYTIKLVTRPSNQKSADTLSTGNVAMSNHQSLLTTVLPCLSAWALCLALADLLHAFSPNCFYGSSAHKIGRFGHTIVEGNSFLSVMRQKRQQPSCHCLSSSAMLVYTWNILKQQSTSSYGSSCGTPSHHTQSTRFTSFTIQATVRFFSHIEYCSSEILQLQY